MNDFFLNLKSPGWWLGVVVVSFLINLASAYAKPFIDRCMAQISDRRRKKLEIAKNELEREAEITERKPDGVVLVTLEELKFVLAALLCTSFCILILVFVALPSSLFSASKPPTEFLLFIPVLLLLALTCMYAANKKATLLKVLKARRDEMTSRRHREHKCPEPWVTGSRVVSGSRRPLQGAWAVRGAGRV